MTLRCSSALKEGDMRDPLEEIEQGALREAVQQERQFAPEQAAISGLANALDRTPGTLLNDRPCAALVQANGNSALAAQWLYECDEAHEPGSGQCPFCAPKESHASP
jgi:hypothetical protein